MLGSVIQKEIALSVYISGLKWAILGCALAVLVLVILQAVSLSSKELIVTEDKVVLRYGVFDVQNAIIPLAEIRIVESKQRVFQRIIRTGDISIVSDAERPYLVKGIVAADRLTSRIMKQANYCKKSGDNKKMRIVLAQK